MKPFTDQSKLKHKWIWRGVMRVGDFTLTTYYDIPYVGEVEYNEMWNDPRPDNAWEYEKYRITYRGELIASNIRWFGYACQLIEGLSMMQMAGEKEEKKKKEDRTQARKTATTRRQGE